MRTLTKHSELKDGMKVRLVYEGRLIDNAQLVKSPYSDSFLVAYNGDKIASRMNLSKDVEATGYKNGLSLSSPGESSTIWFYPRDSLQAYDSSCIYKVGDRVKVREDLHELPAGRVGLLYINDKMKSLAGTVLTIESNVGNGIYRVGENDWLWDDWMIKGKVESEVDEKTYKEYKVGDRIYLRDNLKAGDYYGNYSYEGNGESGEWKIVRVAWPHSEGVYYQIQQGGVRINFISPEMIDHEATESLCKEASFLGMDPGMTVQSPVAAPPTTEQEVLAAWEMLDTRELWPPPLRFAPMKQSKPSIFKFLSKKSMDLIGKMKMALLGEPEKSLMKAGVIDDRQELTDDGVVLFITWLFGKNKKEFTEEIVKKILGEEEASKSTK